MVGVTLLGASTFAPGSARAIADQPDAVSIPDSPRAADSPRTPDSPRLPDWPRLLGADYSGRSVSFPTGVDPTSQPEVAWSIDVGGGYGIGVVANGHYYHFDAVPPADDPDSDAAGLGMNRRSGTFDHRLRKIDATDGRVIWTARYPSNYQDMYGYEAGPRTSPTVAGDAVYTAGVSGAISCFDAADGSLRWQNQLSERYGVVQNFFGVGGSPLVHDGVVYAMVGGSPPEDADVPPGALDRLDPAGNGSLLVAMDAATGRVRWSAGEDLASYSSPRMMTVSGRDYVLMYGRSSLWVFDTDGNVVDSFEHRATILESVNAITPVVTAIEDDSGKDVSGKDDSGNAFIFLSDCYQLGSVVLRFDGRSLGVVWRDPPRDRRSQSLRSHWSGPVLVDGYLYGPSGRNAPDSSLRCVRLRDGKLMWEAMPRTRTSVSTLGDHLLVWSERGQATVAPLSPESFTPVATWRVSDLATRRGGEPVALSYPCWAAPVVVGSAVLLRGDATVVMLRYDDRSDD